MYTCTWECWQSIDKYKRLFRIKEQVLNTLSLAKMDSRNIYVASMDCQIRAWPILFVWVHMQIQSVDTLLTPYENNNNNLR